MQPGPERGVRIYSTLIGAGTQIHPKGYFRA
jgi:hypothetical protein